MSFSDVEKQFMVKEKENERLKRKDGIFHTRILWWENHLRELFSMRDEDFDVEKFFWIL
jgi:hypothetical protein